MLGRATFVLCWKRWEASHGLCRAKQAPLEEPQRPRTKKKRTARNVSLAVVAFFLVVAVGAGVYAFNLASSFNSKSQKIEQAFPDDAAGPRRSRRRH